MRSALLGAAALVALLAAAPPPKTGTVVHIRDDKFQPASITVKAGEKVTFINDDDDAHTATADDGSWDSEGLNQGQKWVHAFTKSGTIKYHCTVHPFMHGTLVVKVAK
ncbi:MAG: cupredoxin family copper-binding protein [Candidatus Eremiobacteraeota bacterium]|nr:cupredoxin family copper-binding protein [Candidatus Eremiobacteraeota bacterium]MBV8643854.1 cupredoxin family copper-binding protein [Candidatus Eremiobacteraeota bacterium]